MTGNLVDDFFVIRNNRHCYICRRIGAVVETPANLCILLRKISNEPSTGTGYFSLDHLVSKVQPVSQELRKWNPPTLGPEMAGLWEFFYSREQNVSWHSKGLEKNENCLKQ